MARSAIAVECSRPEASRAKPHFDAGAKAFRIGELDKAAVEFKAAYEACPSPLFLYNLGQTYRQRKEPEKALYFYKQYLSTTSAEDEHHDEVAGLVAKLEAQHAAERQAAAQAAPPPVGPPLSSSGATPSANDSLAVTASAPATTTGKTPVYKQWWLWTIVGVAVAGAAVGVGVGVTRSSSQPYIAPGVTF
jgi:hypothetical protein